MGRCRHVRVGELVHVSMTFLMPLFMLSLVLFLVLFLMLLIVMIVVHIKHSTGGNLVIPHVSILKAIGEI